MLIPEQKFETNKDCKPLFYRSNSILYKWNKGPYEIKSFSGETTLWTAYLDIALFIFERIKLRGDKKIHAKDYDQKQETNNVVNMEWLRLKRGSYKNVCKTNLVIKAINWDNDLFEIIDNQDRISYGITNNWSIVQILFDYVYEEIVMYEQLPEKEYEQVSRIQKGWKKLKR